MGSEGVPVDSLAILGLLLFFGLLLPRLLKRLNLPFATALILVGSLTGPYGVGWIEPDPSLALFGSWARPSRCSWRARRRTPWGSVRGTARPLASCC